MQQAPTVFAQQDVDVWTHVARQVPGDNNLFCVPMFVHQPPVVAVVSGGDLYAAEGRGPQLW